jgi:hypothetical protein
MVAKINTGKSMRGALHYNEQKVAAGTAKILSAHQFGLSGRDMSLAMKLAVFNGYTTRNRRTKTNVVHISLNFHPKEKLSDRKLTDIAQGYMSRIGFDGQPYLIYHHFDAAHPHLHIVSTNITHEGKRIPLHNIGKTLSEKARTGIEQEFGLMKAAEMISNNDLTHSRPILAVEYGKDETKGNIASVVNAVLRHYKFISLHQLNAVLKRYNVVAIECSEGSVLRRRGGLLYSVLNRKGEPIGVPIKASSLQGKPTLKKLGKLFELNHALREAYKETLRKHIDSVLLTTPREFGDVTVALERRNVNTVVRKNDQGRIYGLTFIDENTGCVFNGSELGKGYSAAAITKVLAEVQRKNPPKPARTVPSPGVPDRDLFEPGDTTSFSTSVGDVLQELIKAEQLDHSNYNPLLQKKRKRKRRSI